MLLVGRRVKVERRRVRRGRSDVLVKLVEGEKVPLWRDGLGDERKRRNEKLKNHLRSQQK